MLEKLVTKWRQWRCEHGHVVTRTYFDNGGVCRETQCVTCGKWLLTQPISIDETYRLLDLAAKAKAENT